MNATQDESNSMKQLYIVLVRADQVCLAGDWPYGQAVYYDPGSVSLYSGETLSYCFLEFGPADELWVWSQAQARLSDPLAKRAVSLVDQTRRRLESELPADWQMRFPGQRTAALDAHRLLYFEPAHPYLKPMWQLLCEQRALTSKQVATIQQIKAERGGLQGLRHRQLIQWRLMRLAEIELEPSDRATVIEFQRQATEPLGLKRVREPVLGALEAKYQDARDIATVRRARQIVLELQQERAR
jgi:hypothetical protein